MKIHVVRPGDNPWTLSQLYNISAQNIIEANELSKLPHLILGQALVIPIKEKSYTVHSEDSLWSIANRFDMSVDGIVNLNNLTTTSQLYPGLVLRIPEKSKNYGIIETNGFIKSTIEAQEDRIIDGSGRLLTYTSPFSYRLDEKGSLILVNDENILIEGRRSKSAPLLTVTNLSEENFNTTLINNIMAKDQLQQTLIDNIESTIRIKGCYGVIVDFERISPEYREHYNRFLKKLVMQLHQYNYVVATTLAPKTYDVTTGASHSAHDYKAHGKIVDFVIIMTYGWGWSGGPPLAVAPITKVRKVISYAVSVIPSKKVMMGMPLYGYDWALPYTPGGEFAKSIGMQEALQIAAKYRAIIKYDQRSQSPYFNYIDENKISHEVWFEDARSAMAKYLMVNRYGLRGVSYWALGKPFPQNWEVLDNMFHIAKITL